MPFLTEDGLVNMLQTQFGRVATTAPTSYLIAAVTTPPEDETGLNLGEPDDPSYARLTVANNTTNFVVDTDPNLAVVNNSQFLFEQATTDWGAVMGIALYAPGSPATFVGYIEFANPRTINTGDTLIVPAEGMRLNVDLTPITSFIQEEQQMYVLTSPNGLKRFALTVSNTGTLSTKDMGEIVAPPAMPGSFAYDGSGTFSWTAPSTPTTNSPITSYTLWKSDAGDGSFTILPQDELSYTLPTGETGVFYLTADNPAGSSVPTASITVA